MPLDWSLHLEPTFPTGLKQAKVQHSFPFISAFYKEEYGWRNAYSPAAAASRVANSQRMLRTRHAGRSALQHVKAVSSTKADVKCANFLT